MGDNKERYLTAKQAAQILGIHPITLYRWVKKGKIRHIRTPTGRIKFPYSEIMKLKNLDVDGKNAIIYARVPDNSFVDSGLLDRQVYALKRYAESRGYEIVDILADVGLINKKSIVKLLNLAVSRRIDRILVVDDTRLVPVLFDVFKEIFNTFGVTIETIEFNDKELESAKKSELIDILKMYLKKI